MILYKYIPADRIDILENFQIRFTQPNAMNDPFEARPFFHSFATREGFAKAFADGIRQEPRIWEVFRNAGRTDLDIHGFVERIERDPDYAEQFYEDTSITIRLPEERKKVYRWCNIVGILSLSETPDNLLMWAHYAVGHTGFVLEFDGCHDFFKTDNPLLGFTKPKCVHYTSERPRTTIEEVSESELFLTKGSHWEYEREWRYLKYLNDANERFTDANNLDVNLFRLPPKCIVGVILGCYRDPELENRILALRRNCPELHHLRVQHARASNTRYRLKIEEIET